MQRCDPSDVVALALGEAATRWSLREPLDAEGVALNRYRIGALGRLPWGLHAHADQEELFVVLEGTLTFETLEGTVDVEVGDAIRFAPGEYQAGTNAGTVPVEYLAIGVPATSEDVRIPRLCPSCSSSAVRLDPDAGLRCPTCGTTLAATCPDCGADERAVHLATSGDGLVDVCRGCGRSKPYDHPAME